MPARILALPGAREVVRTVAIDSWEVGPQNWTESMPEAFRRLAGFEVWDALPAVLGYRVGDDAETDRRRGAFDAAVAELVAENYYDHFAELCHAAGVKALVEPYGGPFDPVRCGRAADVPAGEFWLGSAPGHSVARAVEIARRHGKNVVAAEAFTTEAAEGRWQATPAQLRRAGDEAWMAGVNRLVYHSYVHQPFTDRAPGCSLGRHGTQLNANTTWWPQMRVWSDYVRRGQFLLRFGRIARDRHEIAPGAVDALVREGDAGERVWFVRNKSAEPFAGTLPLDGATGLPAAEFDAATGRVLEVARDGDGVAVSLAPGEARFFVFARGLRPERRPVLSGGTLDLSRGWRIAAFDGLAAPAAPVAADPLFDWTASADEPSPRSASTASSPARSPTGRTGSRSRPGGGSRSALSTPGRTGSSATPSGARAARSPSPGRTGRRPGAPRTRRFRPGSSAPWRCIPCFAERESGRAPRDTRAVRC